MNSFRSRARLVMAALILACLPFAAIADVYTTKASLEDCLTSALASESAKAKPSVDNLIGATCRAEYDSFMRKLSAPEREVVKQRVREIIQKKLKQ